MGGRVFVAQVFSLIEHKLEELLALRIGGALFIVHSDRSLMNSPL